MKEKIKLDETDFECLKKLNEDWGIYYLFAAQKPKKGRDSEYYNIDFVSHINEEQEKQIREILFGDKYSKNKKKVKK